MNNARHINKKESKKMAEKIINCPNCQQQLSIDEQYMGMEVECPFLQR